MMRQLENNINNKESRYNTEASGERERGYIASQHLECSVSSVCYEVTLASLDSSLMREREEGGENTIIGKFISPPYWEIHFLTK